MLGNRFLRYLAALCLLAATLYLSPTIWLARYIRAHDAEAFVVASGAMMPTLKPGDRFLLNKHARSRRWSVVVIEHPDYRGAQVVTRIVGLPGETIEIVAGELHINGAPVTLPVGAGPYTNMTYQGYHSNLAGSPGAGTEGHPIHLGSDEYFL
ncbi:MAG TPA: signal peptidase I, partial [Phycisphaerae bacterium]